MAGGDWSGVSGTAFFLAASLKDTMIAGLQQPCCSHEESNKEMVETLIMMSLATEPVPKF